MRSDTILVIPFADGIGDFVNVQPLVAALKRRFPESAFTIAASEHGNMLVNDPTVEVLKPSGLGYEPGPLSIALRPLLPQRLLAWMAGPTFDRELGPFDLVINFFYAWERGMDFRTYWTPQIPLVPGAVHTLDFLADEIERELELTIPHEQRKPYVALRPGAVKFASHFWREHSLDEQRVVALVPSTNMVIKRWPLSNWLALDKHLREQGVSTLLFCDRPNSTIQKAFANSGSEAIPMYSSLDNVGALLNKCDLVVGVDTGLLHMAGALDVPWVGLFGPTNPYVTGPYDRSNGVPLIAPFEKQPACGGCWKHFKYQDDSCRTFSEGSCMEFLAEETVVEACLRLLEKGRVQTAPQHYTFPTAHPYDVYAGGWAGSGAGY